jgi:hypothetical protein
VCVHAVSGGLPGLTLHYIRFELMRTGLSGGKQPAALVALRLAAVGWLLAL